MPDIYLLSPKQIRKAIKNGFIAPANEVSPNEEIYIALPRKIEADSIVDILDKSYNIVGGMTVPQAWNL